jgi:hypothetical protein
MTDRVECEFGRHKKIKDQARILTKWLKMMFSFGWGRPRLSGTRYVYDRLLAYGEKEEVPVKDVRSHITKHGASENIGKSGAPWPVCMAVQKNANKSAFRIYHTKESVEISEYRQLLNAPPGLRRTDRVFSNLDVMLAIKKELSIAHFRHAQQAGRPLQSLMSEGEQVGRGTLCGYTHSVASRLVGIPTG